MNNNAGVITHTVDVRSCARCSENHLQLKFTPLDNPADDFAFWSMCPVKQQPILMAVRANDPRQNETE